MGEHARADRSTSALRVERKGRGLSTVVTAPVRAHRSVIRRPRPAGRTRRSTVRWALVLADLLGLTTATAVAYLLTQGGIGFDPLLLALPAWGALAGFYGLYKRDRVGADNATLDEVWPIFNCVTVASFAVFAVVQAFGPSHLHGGRVVAFWALASVAIPAYRSIARTLLRRQLALKQRAVVVGAGLVGQEIARKVLRQPSYGLDLVGFVDPEPPPAARGAATSARPRLDRRSGRVAGLARHRPCRVGVYRRSSGRPGCRPGLQRDGRAGRHRAAPVRGRRQPGGGVLARGHAAPGPDAAGAGRLAQAGEALDGHLRSHLRAGRALAALPRDRDRDPA